MKRLLDRKLVATTLGIATAIMLPATSAQAACDANSQINNGINGGASCAQGSSIASPSLPDQIKNITNTLLLVIGAISVIMILIGGMRYVLSGGDEAGTRSAKDTILYSVIGLIIALLAYVIVNFVLKQLHVIA